MSLALRCLGVGSAQAVELGSACAVVERGGEPLLMIDCGGEALTAYLARYGAAPLLGVRGVSMICHGNSDPTAICVAIKDAVQAAESGMNAMMGERLGAVASTFSPTAA